MRLRYYDLKCALFTDLSPLQYNIIYKAHLTKESG